MRKLHRLVFLSLLLMIFLWGCNKYIPTSKEGIKDTTEDSASQIDVEDGENQQSTEESGDSKQNSDESEVSAGKNENEMVREMPDWVDTAVIYEVNIRQYTKEGTFEAFEEHLDRLQSMGINTLWLMPIHPISETKRLGSLGSYYSISNYKEINPEFGSAESFKHFVEVAHEKGFKVIMDWVANHTGWDHEWMEHPEWYLQDTEGNILSPPGMGWNDVAQLNYENQELRAAMVDAMAYWITEYDIDGFRCDYASGVPRDFWEEARVELTKRKELYMLAEDNSIKALLLSAFDSNYNWSLYDGLVSVAKGSKAAKNLRSLIKAYEHLPDGTFPMNFLDNHDKNSWEGTMKEIFGEDAIPAMTALLFTIPGVPLIYSGQEAGLDHRLEFFEKDEISWDSLIYEELITKLAHMKVEYSALHNGLAGGDIIFHTVDNNNILSYSREKDGDKITVILNLSKEKQEFILEEPLGNSADIILHGGALPFFKTEGNMSEVELKQLTTLEPWEYYIFKMKGNQ